MIIGDLQTLLLSWRVQGAGLRGQECLLLSQGRPWVIRVMHAGTEIGAGCAGGEGRGSSRQAEPHWWW